MPSPIASTPSSWAGETKLFCAELAERPAALSKLPKSDVTRLLGSMVSAGSSVASEPASFFEGVRLRKSAKLREADHIVFRERCRPLKRYVPVSMYMSPFLCSPDRAGDPSDPGRYHVDQIEADPLPSGHTWRRWGIAIKRPDGSVDLEPDPWDQ